MKRIAIYPGSFDPITIGHIDIIKRSSKMFDEVIVLLAVNPNKKCRFSIEDRIEMLKESLKEFSNVTVDYFSGLIVTYAKNKGACAIIRGLRVVSDFEYEWSLSAANEFIDKDIEMVFLMAHKELAFISSSTINELFTSGVDITGLVPPIVIEKYKVRYLN